MLSIDCNRTDGLHIFLRSVERYNKLECHLTHVVIVDGDNSVMSQKDMVLQCYCKVVKTLWTELNLGGKFYGCKNYRLIEACQFFHWMDGPLEEHYKDLINGLLRKINSWRVKLRSYN